MNIAVPYLLYIMFPFEFETNLTSSVSQKEVFYLIIPLLIAPFIETLLFQELFYLIFKEKKILEKKYGVVLMCLTSAFCFGLWHFESPIRILITTIMGFYLMFLFYLSAQKRKDGGFSSFLILVITHFLINLSVFIIKL